jgi:hypothetical protein
MNDTHNEGTARDGLLVRMAMLVPPIISSMEGMISSRKTFFHNIRLLIDQDPPIRLNDPVVGMYKHDHGMLGLYIADEVTLLFSSQDIERVHFYMVYHGENEYETQVRCNRA